MKKNYFIILLQLFTLQVTYAIETHHYEISFSSDLRQISVNIQLSKPVSRLIARNSSKHLFIEPAKDCSSKQFLNYSGSSIYPQQNTECISYSMRLDQKLNTPSNKVVATAQSEWLFLPRLSSQESISIKVKKDTNHSLSVPWKIKNKINHTYQISASPQSADGIVVLGDFVQKNIQHHQTELRIAYLPGNAVDHDKIETWLRKTIDNVRLVYGQFPNPSPQIIISAQGRAWSRHKSPVPYARVIREFGESVQFFIDQRQSLDQFTQDWTATHEFSHLLLPYISWSNRWLSEGFASYYQNVLLARANVYSEKRAWQKLYDGFMRGKRSAPELSPNSAAREDLGANMKVYWSGAALFFVADQTLRRESNNTKSLDQTLAKLKACCLPSNKAWKGSQLMRKLDELSESKVFTRLYRKYANNNEFVDFESEFEKLGINIKNGKVKLLNDKKFVQLRNQVMQK